MSESNETTIKSYDAHIQEYIDGTPQSVEGFVDEWIGRVLSGLPHDARILELGTAFGRDADYIESNGYTVQRTDVTPGFVQLLQSQGHEARLLNAITDDLGGPFDLIYANAVLLHFTPEESQAVLTKVHENLVANGRFAFSLKYGEGEEWTETKLNAPRYFHYWTEKSIEPLLRQAGYSNAVITNDSASNTDGKPKWLHIIAVKNS